MGEFGLTSTFFVCFFKSQGLHCYKLYQHLLQKLTVHFWLKTSRRLNGFLKITDVFQLLRRPLYSLQPGCDKESNFK